jgi:hypothetical protein
MSVGLAVSAITAIVAATVGYVGTYVNTRLAARRSDQVKRLSAQMRDLYGPLAALLTSTDALYQIWRTRQLPLEHGWKNSTPEEQEEWRHWMTTVLMPLNRRMSQIVTTHADLIEEDHMPAELIALCAHVESYGGLLARWEADRFDRYLPHILFPDVVIEYSLRHFNQLKAKQAQLLGRRGLPKIRRERPTHPAGLEDWQAFMKKYAQDYFRDGQLDETSSYAGTTALGGSAPSPRGTLAASEHSPPSA